MTECNRNTVQKEVVKRIVLSACDHPTAETVYNRAKAELPTISLGTVYRILKRLALDGEVREISVGNAPSVFDKTLKMHAHLVCSECGAVVDVMMDDDAFWASVSDTCGHDVSEAQVLFGGVCSACNGRTI